MTRITVASLLNNPPAPTAPAANTASTSTVPPGPLPRTTVASQTAPRAGMPPDPRGTPFGSRWLKEASHVQFMQQLRQSGATATDRGHIAEFCEFLEKYTPQASSGETVTNIAQFQALATPEIRRALVNDAMARPFNQGRLQSSIRSPIQRLIANINNRLHPYRSNPYSELSGTERPVMERVDALPDLSPNDRSRYKSFIKTLAQLKPTLPGDTRPINIVRFQELSLANQQILLNDLDHDNKLTAGMRAAVERVQSQLAPPPANSAT